MFATCCLGELSCLLSGAFALCCRGAFFMSLTALALSALLIQAQADQPTGDAAPSQAAAAGADGNQSARSTGSAAGESPNGSTAPGAFNLFGESPTQQPAQAQGRTD